VTEIYQTTEEHRSQQLSLLSKKAESVRSKIIEDKTLPPRWKQLYQEALTFDLNGKKKATAPQSPLHFYLTDIQTLRLLSLPKTSKPSFVHEAQWKIWSEQSMNLYEDAMTVMLQVPISSDQLASLNATYDQRRQWSILDLPQEMIRKDIFQFLAVTMHSPAMRRGITSIPTAPKQFVVEVPRDSKSELDIWKLLPAIVNLVSGSPIFVNDAFMTMVLCNAFYVIMMHATGLPDFQGFNLLFSVVFIDWFLFLHIALLRPEEFFDRFLGDSSLRMPTNPLLPMLRYAHGEVKGTTNSFWLFSTIPEKPSSTTNPPAYSLFSMTLEDWKTYSTDLPSTSLLFFTLARNLQSEQFLLRSLGDTNSQTFREKESSQVVAQLIQRYFSKNERTIQQLYGNLKTDVGLLLLVLEQRNHHETDRGIFLRNSIDDEFTIQLLVRHLSPAHQITEERFPPDLVSYGIGPDNLLLYFLSDVESPCCLIMNIGDTTSFLFESKDRTTLRTQAKRLIQTDLVKDINALPLLFPERIELLRLFVRCLSFWWKEPTNQHLEPASFMDFARAYMMIVTISFALDNPYFHQLPLSTSLDATGDYRGLQYYMNQLVPFAHAIGNKVLHVLGKNDRFQSFVMETASLFSMARRSMTRKLEILVDHIHSFSNSAQALEQLEEIVARTNNAAGITREQQQVASKQLDELRAKIQELLQTKTFLETKIQNMGKYAIQEQEHTRYYMCSLAVIMLPFTMAQSPVTVIRGGKGKSEGKVEEKQQPGLLLSKKEKEASQIQLFFHFLYLYSDLENEDGDWMRRSVSSVMEGISTRTDLAPDPHMISQLHSTATTFFPLLVINIAQRILGIQLSCFSPSLIQRIDSLLRLMLRSKGEWSTESVSEKDRVEMIVNSILSDTDRKNFHLTDPLRHVVTTVVHATSTSSPFATTLGPGDNIPTMMQRFQTFLTSFLYSNMDNLFAKYFLGGEGGIVTGKTTSPSPDASKPDPVDFLLLESGILEKLETYRALMKEQMTDYEFEPILQSTIFQSVSMEKEGLTRHLLSLMDQLEWNSHDFASSVFVDSFMTSAYRVRAINDSRDPEIVSIRVNKRYVSKYEYRQEPFYDRDPHLDTIADTLHGGYFEKERPWIFTEVIQRIHFLGSRKQQQAMGFMIAVLETPSRLFHQHQELPTLGDRITPEDYTRMDKNPAYTRFRWSLHQYVQCYLTLYWLNHASKHNVLFQEPMILECMQRAFSLVIVPFGAMLGNPDDDQEVEWCRWLTTIMSPQYYSVLVRKQMAMQTLAMVEQVERSKVRVRPAPIPAPHNESDAETLEQVTNKVTALGYTSMLLYSLLWTIPPNEEFWRQLGFEGTRAITSPVAVHHVKLNPTVKSSKLQEYQVGFAETERDLAQHDYLTVFWATFRREIEDVIYTDWVPIPVCIEENALHQENVLGGDLLNKVADAMHLMETQPMSIVTQREDEAVEPGMGTLSGQPLFLEFESVYAITLTGFHMKHQVIATSILFMWYKWFTVNPGSAMYGFTDFDSIPGYWKYIHWGIDAFPGATGTLTDMNEERYLKEVLRTFVNLKEKDVITWQQLTYQVERQLVQGDRFAIEEPVSSLFLTSETMEERHHRLKATASIPSFDDLILLLGPSLGTEVYQRLAKRARHKIRDLSIWWALPNYRDQRLVDHDFRNQLYNYLLAILQSRHGVNPAAAVTLGGMLLLTLETNLEALEEKNKRWMDAEQANGRFATTNRSLEAFHWRTLHRRRGMMMFATNPHCEVFTMTPPPPTSSTSLASKIQVPRVESYQTILKLSMENPLLHSPEENKQLALIPMMRMRKWNNFLAVRWSLMLRGRKDLVQEVDGTAFVQVGSHSTPIPVYDILDHGSLVDVAHSDEDYFFEPGFLLSEFGANMATELLSETAMKEDEKEYQKQRQEEGKKEEQEKRTQEVEYRTSRLKRWMGQLGLAAERAAKSVKASLPKRPPPPPNAVKTSTSTPLLGNIANTVKIRPADGEKLNQRIQQYYNDATGKLFVEHRTTTTALQDAIQGLHTSIVKDQWRTDEEVASIKILVPRVGQSTTHESERALLWYNLLVQLHRCSDSEARAALFQTLRSVLIQLEKDPSSVPPASFWKTLFTTLSNPTLSVITTIYRKTHVMKSALTSSSSSAMMTFPMEEESEVENRDLRNMEISDLQREFEQVLMIMLRPETQTDHDPDEEYREYLSSGAFILPSKRDWSNDAMQMFQDYFHLSSPSDTSIEALQPPFVVYEHQVKNTLGQVSNQVGLKFRRGTFFNQHYYLASSARWLHFLSAITWTSKEWSFGLDEAESPGMVFVRTRSLDNSQKILVVTWTDAKRPVAWRRHLAHRQNVYAYRIGSNGSDVGYILRGGANEDRETMMYLHKVHRKEKGIASMNVHLVKYVETVLLQLTRSVAPTTTYADPVAYWEALLEFELVDGNNHRTIELTRKQQWISMQYEVLFASRKVGERLMEGDFTIIQQSEMWNRRKWGDRVFFHELLITQNNIEMVRDHSWMILLFLETQIIAAIDPSKLVRAPAASATDPTIPLFWFFPERTKEKEWNSLSPADRILRHMEQLFDRIAGFANRDTFWVWLRYCLSLMMSVIGLTWALGGYTLSEMDTTIPTFLISYLRGILFPAIQNHTTATLLMDPVQAFNLEETARWDEATKFPRNEETEKETKSWFEQLMISDHPVEKLYLLHPTSYTDPPDNFIQNYRIVAKGTRAVREEEFDPPSETVENYRNNHPEVLVVEDAAEFEERVRTNRFIP
jgi:hypothetical protein